MNENESQLAKRVDALTHESGGSVDGGDVDVANVEGPTRRDALKALAAMGTAAVVAPDVLAGKEPSPLARELHAAKTDAAVMDVLRAHYRKPSFDRLLEELQQSPAAPAKMARVFQIATEEQKKSYFAGVDDGSFRKLYEEKNEFFEEMGTVRADPEKTGFARRGTLSLEELEKADFNIVEVTTTRRNVVQPQDSWTDEDWQSLLERANPLDPYFATLWRKGREAVSQELIERNRNIGQIPADYGSMIGGPSFAKMSGDGGKSWEHMKEEVRYEPAHIKGNSAPLLAFDYPQTLPDTVEGTSYGYLPVVTSDQDGTAAVKTLGLSSGSSVLELYQRGRSRVRSKDSLNEHYHVKNLVVRARAADSTKSGLAEGLVIDKGSHKESEKVPLAGITSPDGKTIAFAHNSSRKNRSFFGEPVGVVPMAEARYNKVIGPVSVSANIVRDPHHYIGYDRDLERENLLRRLRREQAETVAQAGAAE